MKINNPVTQRNIPFPKDKYLVSRTDLKGVITYANQAFVDISGFSREELIGQSHNLVRHPDMPPQMFADLWSHLKRGLPWRGMVKNRAKNGDHYWVMALVVPVRKGGEAIGYISVRTPPSAAEIQAAETLYAQYRQHKKPFSSDPTGLSGWLGRRSLGFWVGGFAMTLLGLTGISNGYSLFAMSKSNTALEQMYQSKLEPSTQANQVMLLLGENRSQIMLALQHAPTNPYLSLHDHQVSLHIDNTLKNKQDIDRLLGVISQLPMTEREKALMSDFAAAREAFSRQGIAPARDALKAGQFDEANLILLKHINPLYADVRSKGQALLDEFQQSAKTDFAQNDARFQSSSAISAFLYVLAALIAMMGSLFLVNRLKNSVRKVTRYFDQIGEGNLTENIDISGRNEMGLLTCQLTVMQAHLKSMLDEVTTAAHTIHHECELLVDTTQIIKQQSDQQSSAVQSTAAITEQFAATIRDVSSNASDTAAEAFMSLHQAKEGSHRVMTSMDATANVVNAVERSSGTLQELESSVHRIDQITRVIQEIAAQTNLLALNAAIEAARAGEQGRGFAVVADEVRKLAERTTSSTVDITRTIAEIQEVTRRAVDGMGAAVADVAAGIHMMKESVSGLDVISGTAQTVYDKAQQISSAAQQQAAASEEIASNMQRINTLIDENNHSANTASAVTHDLRHAANTLQKMVSTFRLH